MKSRFLLPLIIANLVVVATGCDSMGPNVESSPSLDLRSVREALNETPHFTSSRPSGVRADEADTSGLERLSLVLWDSTGTGGFYGVEADTSGLE